MAKKKYQSKKHRFKHAENDTGHTDTIAGSQASVSDAPAEAAARVSRQRPVAAPAQVSTRDFSYVSADLKRIVVMAAGLVALELVLWGLLGHTPLGDAVYR